jgi:hypothetical protein
VSADRIAIEELRSPSYRNNTDSGTDACLACGKRIEGKHRLVHLCDGGVALRLPLGERECDTPQACLLGYPIGEGCWRRLVKKLPHIVRFEERLR